MDPRYVGIQEMVSVGVGVGALLGFAPRQAEVPNCNAEEPQWICIQKVQRLLESETPCPKHPALWRDGITGITGITC